MTENLSPDTDNQAELQRLINEGYYEDEARAKLRECDLCNPEDVDTHLHRAPFQTALGQPAGTRIRLCPYCHETFAGNVLMYFPNGYTPDTAKLAQIICGCFNTLEKRISRQRDATQTPQGE